MRFPLMALGRAASPSTTTLNAWLEPFKARNAFNPSVACQDGRWYLAFRHFGDVRQPPFEASLLVADQEASVPSVISLTRHVESAGLHTVADPKLLSLNGEVWVTFNDGWARGQNDLYLMQVTPELGPPLRCRYDRRRPVEKNWAFFVSGRFLRAVYSLDPLRILTAEAPRPDRSELTFRDFYEAPARRHALELTIGTQIAAADNRQFIVAHEKWRVGPWRSYAGRWVELIGLGVDSDEDDPRVRPLSGAPASTRPRIDVSSRRLCASYRALLGEREKHNRHLISCTYFSGLVLRGNRALLGYGINDLRGAFSEVPVTAL